VRSLRPQEGSLLGRAEWIKFMGAFFNHELSANRYYNKVTSPCHCRRRTEPPLAGAVTDALTLAAKLQVKTTYNALSLSAKSSSSKRPVVGRMLNQPSLEQYRQMSSRLLYSAVSRGMMLIPFSH
jgi:hypothetical protein